MDSVASLYLGHNYQQSYLYTTSVANSERSFICAILKKIPLHDIGGQYTHCVNFFDILNAHISKNIIIFKVDFSIFL
jgi:hypothetical protein